MTHWVSDLSASCRRGSVSSPALIHGCWALAPPPPAAGRGRGGTETPPLPLGGPARPRRRLGTSRWSGSAARPRRQIAQCQRPKARSARRNPAPRSKQGPPNRCSGPGPKGPCCATSVEDSPESIDPQTAPSARIAVAMRCAECSAVDSSARSRTSGNTNRTPRNRAVVAVNPSARSARKGRR